MSEPLRVYVQNPDGSTTDITEGVQAMYDLLRHSMDWGSGFLTVEDSVPIARLAKACNFNEWEDAQKYVEFAEKEARRKT